MRYRTGAGVYVIAEIGINHNGDLDEAKRLVRAAVDAGADGIKIQVRHLESIYTKTVFDDPLKAEQGTQYLLSELRKAHFTFLQVEELFAFAKPIDRDFFATPFDITSARFLNDIGMELFKIGSPDMTNLPLLDAVAGFGKPFIISTGMSEEREIDRVVAFLNERKADFALLHCNSTYPAPYSAINLRFIPAMKERWKVATGYSGHEQGYAPTLAAVALGAEIIERHLTMDTAQSGPDHRASLVPEEFAAMVARVREIELALGEPRRVFNQGERSNRLSLAKSLVAAHDLAAGTVLQSADIVAKTPAKGISPLELEWVVGSKLARDVKTDEYFFPEQFESVTPAVASVHIPKKWGIVGRLNDFRDFLDLKPDLVEIHLTWRDLFDRRRVEDTFEQDLVVHAPEYYRDRLIDFSSPDAEVTEYSLEMLQRTIGLAREIAPRFKGARDPRGPRIVVHPGGHFAEPTDSDKTEQYRLLMKHLKELDSEGVRLLVENMPPRPWYFGGRWYNTIFMDGREIAQFAKEMGWGVCFDTSHAGLYANLAGISLADCTRAVLDHIAYLHISDYRGVTEEGLQLGEGEIDLVQFFAMVSKIDNGFIPEIWQGHLDHGRGFRQALKSVESVLGKVSGPSCSDPNCCDEHCTDPAHLAPPRHYHTV
jgi:sialic acid synthase SpsE/sugar phosphate isomerase/epimerase